MNATNVIDIHPFFQLNFVCLFIWIGKINDIELRLTYKRSSEPLILNNLI